MIFSTHSLARHQPTQRICEGWSVKLASPDIHGGIQNYPAPGRDFHHTSLETGWSVIVVKCKTNVSFCSGLKKLNDNDLALSPDEVFDIICKIGRGWENFVSVCAALLCGHQVSFCRSFFCFLFLCVCGPTRVQQERFCVERVIGRRETGRQWMENSLFCARNGEASNHTCLRFPW